MLQVVKLRNISAPKDNEESQAAPRLWRLTLTDGHGNMVAICLEPLRNLRLVVRLACMVGHWMSLVFQLIYNSVFT